MRVLSLCSGIGGIEIGIELAGVHVSECVYVEPDPYAAAILVARMEEGALAPGPVVNAGLEGLDPAALGRIDLVTGGFPCQPASVAGSRKGRDDERWIWPRIAELLAHVRPRAVFLENVPGLLTADRGWALHSVVRDLAALGFVGRYDLFRADAVGAPHRRDRWFCLSVRNDVGEERVPDPGGDALRNLAERGKRAARSSEPRDAEPRDVGEAVADGRRERLEGKQPAGAAPGAALGGGRDALGDTDGGRPEGGGVEERGDIESEAGGQPVGHGCHGRFDGPNPWAIHDPECDLDYDCTCAAAALSQWPPGPRDAAGWEEWLARGGPAPAVSGRLNPAFVEALMGYPVGWTDLGYGDAARRDRLRCLGNAVVPQQAALALKALGGIERG